MRAALNENPVAQVVMLGVLGIVAAFLFMTRVMGQSDEGGATEPVSPSAAAPSASPTPATEAASVPDAPAVSVGFEPGPGLPASAVRAHESGDVVALLVVNRKAIEDRELESELNALRGRGDTTVFVVEAEDVTRYSRIAQGVNLDRVPALVVLEPKRQVEGALPAATVSYGFRGTESVEQAIRDALYNGRALPYHPG